MRLIALFGKKKHGKSTVATHLVKRYHFQEFAFASSLKESCQPLFQFSDAQLHDPDQKETLDPFWGCTPRHALIEVADWVRKELPKRIPGARNLFIKNVFRRMQSLPSDSFVVVSDCRTPEEWQALREAGAIFIKVLNPRIPIDPKADPETENALDDVDEFAPHHVIVNDSSFEHLHTQIQSIVGKLQ